MDHAMNLKTGLEWHEDWRSTATGVNDVYLGSADLLNYTLSKQSATEPGTAQRYSTGDPSLLSGAIQTATGRTAYDYALDVMLRPMGLEGIVWGADPEGRTTTYAGIQATLREFAKLGQLALDEGKWDGAALVSADWIRHTTQAVDPCQEQYRYLWHVNLPMRLGAQSATCPEILGCQPTDFADLPTSGFFAEGIYGQFIFVLPSAGIVAARIATDDAGSEFWDDYARSFLTMLINAIRE
jgi:CubicO group peptidase (beta-lactamase class C family)